MSNIVQVPAATNDGPNLVKVFEEARLIEWEPQQARQREAGAEMVKTYAAAVKDWEMLDRAVEQQIADQRNLVEWWDENTFEHGKGGKRGKDKQQRQPRKTVRRSAHSFRD
jgi:hypothetical protein